MEPRRHPAGLGFQASGVAGCHGQSDAAAHHPTAASEIDHSATAVSAVAAAATAAAIAAAAAAIAAASAGAIIHTPKSPSATYTTARSTSRSRSATELASSEIVLLVIHFCHTDRSSFAPGLPSDVWCFSDKAFALTPAACDSGDANTTARDHYPSNCASNTTSTKADLYAKNPQCGHLRWNRAQIF